MQCTCKAPRDVPPSRTTEAPLTHGYTTAASPSRGDKRLQAYPYLHEGHWSGTPPVETTSVKTHMCATFRRFVAEIPTNCAEFCNMSTTSCVRFCRIQWKLQTSAQLEGISATTLRNVVNICEICESEALRNSAKCCEHLCFLRKFTKFAKICEILRNL